MTRYLRIGLVAVGLAGLACASVLGRDRARSPGELAAPSSGAGSLSGGGSGSLSGGGAGSSPTDPPSPSGGRAGSPEAAEAPPIAIIPAERRLPAPDFSVQTTAGKPFSLSGARGRVVVMSFLAPGCADCTAEVMALKAVHQRLASRGVDVLLVDLGGLTDEEILDYYRKEIGGGPHLYAEDAGFKVAVAYGVQALSTTVVVDRRGRVAYRDEELTPAAKLLAVVERVAREA